MQQQQYQPQQQQQQQQVIKLPYPVLNDKRDMNTILLTLETKFQELMKKISNNLQMKKQHQQNKQQLEKLNQLEKTYESQREKLIKQIDYIR